MYTSVSSRFDGTPWLARALSGGVPPVLSSGGESEMVSVEKRPFISRKSSAVWSLGAVVRSWMKSFMERMMGRQPSPLGSHQSEYSTPQVSSMRFRRTLE